MEGGSVGVGPALATRRRDAVPSVHGVAKGGIGGPVRARLSNHQRNLSLDFRSMGILLPPVAQITSSASSTIVTPVSAATVTCPALTLHHRNRSLDSALQRIPEVDVTPSPECETTANAQMGVAIGNGTGTTQNDHLDGLSSKNCPSVLSLGGPCVKKSDELASLGSDDSGIICNGSDAGSSEESNVATRESSVEFLSDKNDEDEEKKCDSTDGGCEEKRPPPKSSGLLRLLESKVFDVSMAMHYLFNSKEPGVLTYIANKMFTFEEREVDFYLPQLVCMYIQMHDVAEVIHRYLIHRCRNSIDFSLKCAWLLDAFSSDATVPTKKKPHGIKLRNLILSDELRPKDQTSQKLANLTLPLSATGDKLALPPHVKKSHQR
ncbi:unnamed protein product [Acanthoscelides obtectus]|nr:unnamed protein product [Acanthoscelides obtectus]CAK1679899.1 Phosphatidylinositol 4-kinase beta [Acanthoscelides obtectus]